MSEKNLKNVSAYVDKEIIKHLKIFAIQKDLTLKEYIQHVLTKHVESKVKNNSH